jgi:mannobiose 2-epimerase
MEAYTNLLRAWPQPEIREAHRELLTVMLERILNPSTHHLTLFMTETWSPTTDEISFGHDIEASWLLTEAAEVLGDPALLKRVKVIALAVARATLAEGVDSDGSLLYEANPRGITKADREWWPQAEAVVGFFNAYQLSGDETYRKAAFKVWDYIDTHLVDKKHGEWFRAVSRQGAVSRQPKVSLWKCPYHNGRSCLEFVRRIEEMLPAAGK